MEPVYKFESKRKPQSEQEKERMQRIDGAEKMFHGLENAES
jgi:hypothetical protein